MLQSDRAAAIWHELIRLQVISCLGSRERPDDI